jgi:hypothetical protein
MLALVFAVCVLTALPKDRIALGEIKKGARRNRDC